MKKGGFAVALTIKRIGISGCDAQWLVDKIRLLRNKSGKPEFSSSFS